MKVEVAYALVERQYLIAVTLPPIATVEDAIKASGLLNTIPTLDLQQISVGVFSQRAQLSTLVAEGDRVEIYRSLTRDPKVQRRLRAKKNA